MEKSCSKNHLIIIQVINFLLSFALLIALLSSTLFLKLALALGNETDRLALLSLKDELLLGGSAAGALSSWNSSLHFCEWQGVRCGRRYQRVISLELTSQKSGGSISPSISNLTFLREITLFDDALHGNIPTEIGQLRRLRYLNLSNNNLHGGIPIEITNCSNLQQLILSQNNLTGEIPFLLGEMKNLTVMILSKNNLVGKIPTSLGNLSALNHLELLLNHLEGTIPDTLGRLSSLERFRVGANNLSGIVPPSLYNLSSMIEFAITDNQLAGRLPPGIDLAFPNLVGILIGGNQFTGTIPTSLSNISSLQVIQISLNYFSGSVPNSFGNLDKLREFYIDKNNLGSGKEGDLDYLFTLTNCSLLSELSIDENNFGGVFPNFVANLSTQLSRLYMGTNLITGNIPQGIGNLINLYIMGLNENFLVGEIPSSMGKLQNLEGLYLYTNYLSGEIPSSIGNISRLSILSLFNNSFTGGIPLALRNCKNLREMYLSLNRLSTPIPDQLFGSFQSLFGLYLSDNSFSGALPSDFSTLKNLMYLYVDNNNFVGEIPMIQSLGIGEIYMQRNSFQGTIPQSFGSLRSLEFLDLSGNNLSGTIPRELENLPFLVSLNLSFNQLEGEVPKGGVFKNVSEFSFMGNTKLCGGIPELGLPKCSNMEAKGKGKVLSTKILISIILGIFFAFILAVVIVYLFWKRKSKRGLIQVALFGDDGYLRLSYKDLVEATQGFASSNLIGVGSFGYVYKGLLHHQKEKPVAVKVLNLQNHEAAKSFMAECKALRKVRHRNLVKILTSCSSIDFKALIFEFMPNGSLDSWLHQQHESGRCLSLAQRLDIAIDVANAIDYLHHDSETLIVHCDLKPSNVLLGDDMVAHVGDFGLAKLLSSDTSNMGADQTGSSVIKGTIGYVAPEYGMGGAVSPEGDIYSYGIMLLEMITGRRPTNNLFNDGLSLRNFCQTALSGRLEEILDSHLLQEIGEIQQRLRSRPNMEEEIWECLVSFTKIGVACSAEAPSDRMGIKDAIIELHATKARLLRTGIHRQVHAATAST